MDKFINCVICRQDFCFPSGEQAFYQEKGYPDPKRCSGCRRVTTKTPSNGIDMFGRPVYPAVCSNCSTEFGLSFQPDGIREVYCKPCYEYFLTSK